jgi:protein TonB
MKKRILLATALSLFIHWLLFGLNWDFLKGRRIATPKFRNVTITMSYKEPESPAGPPKPEQIKIRKPDIKPGKEIDKKEIVKPAEEEKVSVEPASSEPKEEDIENWGEEISDDTISGTESTGGDKSATADRIPGIKSTAGDESETAFIKEAIPRYRNNPPPVYPRVARRRGHQGTVLLEVLVDQNGDVRNLKVLQSSGYATLDDAALASVKNWSFEPGMKGSQPVEMWVKLPVRFQLK